MYEDRPLHLLREAPLQEQVEVIRDEFAEEWQAWIRETATEDAFTDEEKRFSEDARSGKKLPVHSWVRRRIIHLCDAHQLTTEQRAQVLDTMMG